LGGSVDPEITPDGRYVAFTSTAEDLVDGDTNGLADVFVRDLLENTTECVTVGSASPIFVPGFAYGSAGPRISADGRWVAFSSTATNLVAGVTNLNGEIYLCDRTETTTICPSAMVDDESWVAEGLNVWRRRAFSLALSDDGAFLGFILEATLGVPNANQRLRSLWRFEISSGQATLVTTNLTLSEFVEPTIFTMTPNGRWLAYQTAALENRNDIELWDGDTGITILATPALDGISGADGFCDMPELSADGRFLVFTSNAGNLVTNRIDASSNVFVRDTVAAQTELISRDPAGIGLGGADLAFPGISQDGALVVFDSFSSGHVPDDRNLASDVFLRQREAGVTGLVSRADPRAQSISGSGHSSLGVSPFSEDGERLLFRSESDDLVPGTPTGLGQVYVHNLASGTNALVSVNFEGNGGGNAWCYEQVISGDGRSVVFSSAADNLVAGDDNASQDVFLHDLEARSTILLTRAFGSAASANDTSGFPAISRDGNRIAFLSYATDLVEPVVSSSLLQAYLHDRPTQSTGRVTDPFATSVDRSTPRLSPDGRYLTYAVQRFPSDVWLYDHDTRQDAELLAGSAAASLVGDNFSRDGRYLALFGWDWDSSIRAQGFLLRRNLATGNSEQFTLGPATGSALAEIAMDQSARFLAFSTVLGLVSADTNQLSDVYLLDFDSSTLTLISLNLDRTSAGRGASRAPSISGDGRLVAFVSEADDLVTGDTNNTADIFLFDGHTGKLTVASVNPDGTVANARSSNPHLSATGYRLAFTSLASGLVSGDHNGRIDVFLTTVLPERTSDTDNDGMADEWEREHFGGLQELPEADPDLDGFTNLEEFTAGTDPRDPASQLRLEITHGAAGNAHLHWTAVPGRTYALEYTLDPAGGAWSAAPGIIRVTGAVAESEETAPLPPSQYYRLRAMGSYPYY
jgi:Tol biopolymer transport system component